MLEEATNRRDSRYTCWKKRPIGEIADMHVGRRKTNRRDSVATFLKKEKTI